MLGWGNYKLYFGRFFVEVFFIYVSGLNMKFIFQKCFIFTVFQTCLKPIKSLTYLLTCDPNKLKRTPTKGDYISNIRWMTFNINSPRWFNIIKTLIRCITNVVSQPCLYQKILLIWFTFFCADFADS